MSIVDKRATQPDSCERDRSPRPWHWLSLLPRKLSGLLVETRDSRAVFTAQQPSSLAHRTPWVPSAELRQKLQHRVSSKCHGLQTREKRHLEMEYTLQTNTTRYCQMKGAPAQSALSGETKRPVVNNIQW